LILKRKTGARPSRLTCSDGFGCCEKQSAALLLLDGELFAGSVFTRQHGQLSLRALGAAPGEFQQELNSKRVEIGLLFEAGGQMACSSHCLAGSCCCFRS